MVKNFNSSKSNTSRISDEPSPDEPTVDTTITDTREEEGESTLLSSREPAPSDASVEEAPLDIGADTQIEQDPVDLDV